jgi:death-on-curing protein
MTHRWPDAVNLLALLAQATGPGSQVRDPGILCAVANRPHSVLLDQVVYPTLLEQAAALLHGIIVWRPLELWNTGLAWAAALSLLARNGLKLDISAWEQMSITEEISSGRLDDVSEITIRLAPFLRIRPV